MTCEPYVSYWLFCYSSWAKKSYYIFKWLTERKEKKKLSQDVKIIWHSNFTQIKFRAQSDTFFTYCLWLLSHCNIKSKLCNRNCAAHMLYLLSGPLERRSLLASALEHPRNCLLAPEAEKRFSPKQMQVPLVPFVPNEKPNIKAKHCFNTQVIYKNLLF